MKSSRYLLAVLTAFFLSTGIAFAKKEKWTGPDGKTFNGQPVDIIGPLAIFDTGSGTARRIPFHLLSDADAIRFADLWSKIPSQGGQWSAAKSGLGFALADSGMKLKDGKLAKVDVKGQKEPWLYVVFYASSGEGPSWEFTGTGTEKYNLLKPLYPADFEMIMVGLKHNNSDQTNMFKSMGLPFWSIGPRDLSVDDAVTRSVPETPMLAVITTRDGTPLRYAAAKEELPAFWTDLEDLLKLGQNSDSRGWRDRLGFYTKIQPHLFAKGSTGPLLVVDPFDRAKLKSVGVMSFAATLSVNAKGEVTSVMLKGGGVYPEAMGKDLRTVLKQMVFVGAVNNGAFVDSDFEYSFDANR